MKVKIIFFYTIILLLSKQAYLLAIENKILFKIENKIITSIDIFNEINYLKIINKDIEKLGDEKIFQIAKNSLIKEKIKEIEILKQYKKIDLNSEFLEERIINYYSKLGIKSLEDFNLYFNNQNLNVSNIKKKIAIQAYWNNLIYSIYSEKVVINKNKIRQIILNNSKKKTKSYLLSEIVFEVENKQEKNRKFDEVKKSIIQEGFNNTAILFSISLSSKKGGEIGWINENSLNQKIKNELNKISVGQNTDPIKIVGGFLILKINEIKTEEIKIDVDKELNKIINQKLNEQLNNFSNIYFNKVKKNIQIENI